VTAGDKTIVENNDRVSMPDPGVMSSFALAYEPLSLTGVVRQVPGDFVVEELLGFAPIGEGEHRWLQIQKCGITTHQVACAVARRAGVPQRDVGYSGLKDRNAVTTQWFSVLMSGLKEPDWDTLNSESLRIVRSIRHHRKLRRGTHRANWFRVVVRNVEGSDTVLQERLVHIQRRGVPNYFGRQRFGHEGNNLRRAEQLFTGRRERNRVKRGLYLSAARSWIFNHVLSQRVNAGTWDRLQPGDVAMLDGTRSVFPVENVDAVLQRRVARGDVHPTGPLAGAGDGAVGRDVMALEAAVAARFPGWGAGLTDAGMRHERRSLRLLVRELRWWSSDAGTWTLEFGLQRGQFATAMLRECGRFAA
jgi:tRNA pseudouridine13 synthase